MKKAEAEKAIRHLCGVWGKTKGFTGAASEHPSWYEFKRWLGENGYNHYLNFRSVAGDDYDAEMWFDQEFKQTWRH